MTGDFFWVRDLDRMRCDACRLRTEKDFGESLNDLKRDSSSKSGRSDMMKTKNFGKTKRFSVTRELRSEDQRRT